MTVCFLRGLVQNVLVARIRQLTREQWYRREKGYRRYETNQQADRVCDYSDAMVGSTPR
jgi:hypothetical protein